MDEFEELINENKRMKDELGKLKVALLNNKS